MFKPESVLWCTNMNTLMGQLKGGYTLVFCSDSELKTTAAARLSASESSEQREESYQAALIL